MRLNTEEWKQFKFTKLFGGNPPKGTRLTKEDRVEGTIPLVTAGFNNQGVSDFINNPEMERFYNAMTIDMFGYCFYRSGVFNADDNVLILQNEGFSEYVYLFVSTLIMQGVYRQSYGRQYRKKDYYRDTLKLPIVHETDEKGNRVPKIDPLNKYSEEGYIPDFEYMENYIKSLNYKPLTTKVKADSERMSLDLDNWVEFLVYRDDSQGGLFDIESCKCGNAGDLEEGYDINYIGAKKNDNGVMSKVKKEDSLVTQGGCIVFICDGQGSVGYTNYMDVDFIGSTTLSVGYDDNLNTINAMFFVTMLDKQRDRFSYGRKYRPSFKTITLKLPIQRNENNEPVIDTSKKYSEDGYIPDFEFMESYIKQLPYGDRL